MKRFSVSFSIVILLLGLPLAGLARQKVKVGDKNLSIIYCDKNDGSKYGIKTRCCKKHSDHTISFQKDLGPEPVCGSNASECDKCCNGQDAQTWANHINGTCYL
jgi:hypothetical protein